MRIISGKYRGRNLFSPKDRAVRPTSDKVKEAVFSILQFRLQDSIVADLFAGSGALGIEALSRGASKAYFSDKSRESLALLKKNLAPLNGAVFQIYEGDFQRLLDGTSEKFDFVFLDPPYKSGLGARAIGALVAAEKLKDGGLIVYERSADEGYILPDGAKLTDSRTYGNTVVDFISAV